MNGYDTGYVYFIAQEPLSRGLVKVGWAREPRLRRHALQSGNPDDLVLIGFAPGTREDEAWVHSSLARYRYRGEWFRIPYPGAVLARAWGRRSDDLGDLLDAALNGTPVDVVAA